MRREDVEQSRRDVRGVERAQADAGQARDLGDLVQEVRQVGVLRRRPVPVAGGGLAVSPDVDAG